MSEKPALRPDLAVGEALRAIAHDILSDARTAIESPDHSDAVAVHEFRREMKSWRALLRLLEPFLGEESEGLQTAARDLARDLGGARDPQSALESLDDLKEHGLPLSDRSIKTVRKRIDDLRTAGEMSALTLDMRLRIAEALADAGAAVYRWPLHDVTFADVAKQLAASYRAARRAAPKSWSDAGPEALHELRKLVVIHRYQMQIVEPLWQRFTKMWITEAQRLREEAQTLLASYQRKQREAAQEAEDIVNQAKEDAALHRAEARKSLEEMLRRQEALAIETDELSCCPP